jgi:hypothetical protein
MRILITGGTGFIGGALVRRLLAEGHTPLVITRLEPGQPLAGVEYRIADPAAPGPWQQEVSRQDAVVNLAGASIFSRWSEGAKREIRESRILTTRNLVQALPEGRSVLLLSASAVGYYGSRGDEALEEGAPAGVDFLASLCRDWEQEARRAGERGARVILARFGIVLGREGGALAQMIRPFKLFAGGRLGSGRQWLSWIHQADLIEALMFLLGRASAAGAYNLTAPGPVTNRELTRELGRALHRPAWLPAPAFALKALLGEFSATLLTGQRVLPARLLAEGFTFGFPDLASALEDLVKLRS